MVEQGPPKKSDYGIDAPNVVRNLLIVSGIGFLCWASTAMKLWSGELSIGPFGGVRFTFPFGTMGPFFGAGCGAMALWMVWTSRVGKIRNREKLLNQIPWSGEEQVLDVGCGRGLMLIGAAKRLTTGKATGIDIWQAEDLTGNRPEAVLHNARCEGVFERIDVRTADMRKLPFAENTFDVVVSCEAIHNIYSKPDRATAIREIARVLRPGGRAVIQDIRHLRQYASIFAQNGCSDIRRTSSYLVTVFLAIVTMGGLRPGRIVVRKTQ